MYRKAYQLAMEIFDISKQWPLDECYALTGQVRRSFRSVCSNMREAWAKRFYPAHFVSKLTDADGENAETETWLDFAQDSGYLSATDHDRLISETRQIGAMLGSMIHKPEPFLLRKRF
ncbi:MAG: four helix bundle protein [Chloroflexota bacterium]|nr:four helix bundle protein [Chloroflexota bacterium]